MILRTLIVDDEEPARRRLQRLLDERGDIEVVGQAVDGVQAQDMLAALEPDLVFADIEMPRMDGMAFAELAVGCDLIFVTAHNEHAVRAFEVRAVDYLLKPVTRTRLAAAVDEVQLRRRQRAGEPTMRPRLRATSGKSVYFFDPQQIDRFHGVGKYAALCHEGKEYWLEEGLGQLEAQLTQSDPGAFFRCHRSELVRLEAVVAIHAGEGGNTVELRSGVLAPVSRRALAGLRRALS